MKRVPLLIASLLIAAVTSYADSTVELEWSYNRAGHQETIFGPGGVTPLAGSTTGFLVQLGYYSAATTSNPFAGTWIPLFGTGNNYGNTLFSGAAMGDGVTALSGTDDRFSFDGTLDSSTQSGLPLANTIMSIRYYNASTLAAATAFGAASDPTDTSSGFLWISPNNPPPQNGMTFDISLTDPNIMYQGGVGEPETNFSIVPEPATLSLMAGALALGALGWRRRK